MQPLAHFLSSNPWVVAIGTLITLWPVGKGIISILVRLSRMFFRGGGNTNFVDLASKDIVFFVSHIGVLGWSFLWLEFIIYGLNLSFPFINSQPVSDTKTWQLIVIAPLLLFRIAQALIFVDATSMTFAVRRKRELIGEGARSDR